jgi:hypothetical protein
MNTLIGFLIWFNLNFGDSQTDLNIYYNPSSNTFKLELIGIDKDCKRVEVKVDADGNLVYCCLEEDDI